MSDPESTGAEASAEKAYAAATESLPVTLQAEPDVAAKQEVEEIKPIMASEPAKAPEKPAAKVTAKRPTTTAKVVATPAKAAPARRGRPPKAHVAAASKPVKARKSAATEITSSKPAIKPAAKSSAALRKPKIKTAASPMKEKIMDKSSKITDSLKSAVADAQEKAKTVFAKGAAAFGGYTEFTKGNVEAVVESGKILAGGVQKMGAALVTDTKESANSFASELKGFAAAKTPAELLQMQSEMMHRHFDKVVAYNSKTSEATLKLLNDAMAPVAGRLSLTMDKLRKAA